MPLGEVTSEMRRVAKAVNFGVIYGQSPFGLSKMLGIEQSEAAQFIRAYFAGYPGVSAFLERTIADCRQNGFVTTILGRRRLIRGMSEEKAPAEISADSLFAATESEAAAGGCVPGSSAAEGRSSPTPLKGEGQPAVNLSYRG